MVQFIDIDEEAEYAARVRERAKDKSELEKIAAAPAVKSTDLTTEQKREVEPIFDDSDDDDDGVWEVRWSDRDVEKNESLHLMGGGNK